MSSNRTPTGSTRSSSFGRRARCSSGTAPTASATCRPTKGSTGLSAGSSTRRRRRRSMRELATAETLFGMSVSEQPRVVIVGAPLELSSGCRGGGGNGPAAVREASRVLEAYSPALDRDFSEVEVADAGDLELPNDLDDALERIEGAVAEIAGLQRVPVLIGGEHTVSLAAVRALRRLHPDLVLLQVDAHTDLRAEFEGEVISRATWIP